MIYGVTITESRMFEGRYECAKKFLDKREIPYIEDFTYSSRRCIKTKLTEKQLSKLMKKLVKLNEDEHLVI